MMSEFVDELLEISPTHKLPTNEEYGNIEFVYTYHPSIGDKKAIVKLWADFGNKIIEDMMPRARMVMQAENDMRRAEASYKNAKDFYNSMFE